MATKSMNLSAAWSVRRILFATLLMVAVTPAFANTILFNETFDTVSTALSIPGGATFGDSGQLKVTSGDVDIVGGVNHGYVCTAIGKPSGNCLDLNGSQLGAIQMTNSLTFLPGNDYFLSFSLFGAGGGTLGGIPPYRPFNTSTTVSFGSWSHTYDLAPTDFTSGIVSNMLFTVSVPTPFNLTFASNQPAGVAYTDWSPNTGAVVDSILITSAPSASSTPEPATGGVLLLTLTGLFAARRRLLK